MAEEEVQLGEPTTIITVPEGEGTLNVFTATRALRKAREAAANPPAEAKPEPAGEHDPNAPLPDEDISTPELAVDAAPQEAPGEVTEEAEPETVIEPPRSWTKDEKERFRTFPRETQEYLANREQDRERALSRSQQEAAEQRKQFEASRKQAEEVRARYEQALPQMVAAMNAQVMGEFSDIKTWADAEKLAAEDPFRYQRFRLAQDKLQTAQQEQQVAQQRQAQEIEQKYTAFSKEQDELFTKNAPEMSDPAKAKELQSATQTLLSDLGFSESEVNEAWRGKIGLPMRDHRIQLLIRDAVRWRQAQAKAKDVAKAKTPLPPVQRPGVTRPRGAGNEAEIVSVKKQLETARGVTAARLGTRLMQLERDAGRL